MSIVSSLLWGSEGSYQVLNVPVSFEEIDRSLIVTNSNLFVNSVGQCLNSQVFRFMTLSYTQIFVHEMGHAITSKILVDNEPEVTVATNLFGGGTSYKVSGNSWRFSATNLAEPLASMIFSCCKLAAAVLVNKYVSRPAAYLLGTGAVIWMFGEFVYAFTSVARNDGGDFAHIANDGMSHLVVSMAILISTCALGIFASVRLHSSLFTRN